MIRNWEEQSIIRRITISVIAFLFTALMVFMGLKSVELWRANKLLRKSEQEYKDMLDGKDKYWSKIAKERKDSMIIAIQKAETYKDSTKYWRETYNQLKAEEDEIDDIVSAMDSTDILNELRDISAACCVP